MDDSGQAAKAPTMTALFGSDSEDEDNEDRSHEITHRNNKNLSAESPKDQLNPSDDGDDVEFQEDGITGLSHPRSSARISQSKPTSRFSNNDEYDDSNNTGNMLDDSIEVLPSRQIVLSEAPSISILDQFDILSTYSLATKSNLTFHLVQLPKIVAINAEQYDASSFDARAEEEEFQRPVHNMIRWRYASHEYNYNQESKYDLDHVMESNANIIKWSDGTFGLAIGDEVFDLDEFPFSTTQSEPKVSLPLSESSTDEALASKDFLYLSSKALLRSLDETREDDELNDPEDSKISTILQCIVPLQSKLIPRPSSIKSTAHKAFILAEKSRSIKRNNIGEHVPVKDPELEKAERIRNNEDLNRQKKRYSSGEGKSSHGGYGGGRKSFVHDYDDDKFDSVNIKDLKRKSHNIDIDEDFGEEEEEEEEEDEWRNRKKKLFLSARDSSKTGLRSSKASSDESDEDGDIGNAPASDDEVDKVKRIAAHKKRSSVFAEDDEDD